MNRFTHRHALVLVTALACTACGGARAGSSAPIVQPGAPGEAGRVLAAGTAGDLPRPKYTDADVTFMQGMIHHHAQALDMVALLMTRTASDDMQKLGERIRISQTDEIV